MTEIPFVAEPETTPGSAPLQYEQPRAGRVRLTVRAGQRRTISAPADGAIVTQALTTPAQTVSVDERAVRGIREAILEDTSGAERARISA